MQELESNISFTFKTLLYLHQNLGLMFTWYQHPIILFGVADIYRIPVGV